MASATARPRVFFRIVRADGGPEIVAGMNSGVFTCGQQGNLILNDDPFIAPQQARFFFSGTRLVLEDIGGNNGVFVRLRHERELLPGGELRMGRQRLLLQGLAQPSPALDGTLAWGSLDGGCMFRLLQLFEGGMHGGAFLLKPGQNLLGRDSGDITFPSDGFISGKHAVLYASSDRVVVKDVGSSNGTFIRLPAPIFVENGDQLLIGRQLIKIEMQPHP
jgi:pSer/pThr/pTyr-binding forkhead associated (FHA) protein